MYICSICIAEKEIRLCKNIAKFSQNLPFLACKILHFRHKIRDFFLQKNAGTDMVLLVVSPVAISLYMIFIYY